MFTNFKLILAAATFLTSQSLASAIPSTSVEVAARAGGYPASNGPGVSCYNTWETVTNDVSIPPKDADCISQIRIADLNFFHEIARRPILVCGGSQRWKHDQSRPRVESSQPE